MQIHEALVAVMAEVEAIGKNKDNKQQGFKYRGIDDAYNAIQPLLAKHGVFCLPNVKDVVREERQSKSGGNLLYSVATIEYKFMAADGSEVALTVVGEGMDSGDKSMNKAMAVAHKYAIMQMFCIPTEDMPDPDKESHGVNPKQPPAPKQPQFDIDGALFDVSQCQTVDELGAYYSTTKGKTGPHAAKFNAAVTARKAELMEASSASG